MTVEPSTAGRPATTDAPAPSVTVTAAKLELTGSLNFSTIAGGGTVTVDPAAGVIDVSAAWADAARAVARDENTAQQHGQHRDPDRDPDDAPLALRVHEHACHLPAQPHRAHPEGSPGPGPLGPRTPAPRPRDPGRRAHGSHPPGGMPVSHPSRLGSAATGIVPGTGARDQFSKARPPAPVPL